MSGNNKGKATQWISTTKSLEIALSRYGQYGVMANNLLKVASEIVDISNGIPGSPGMLSNWAKKSQEVLIKDFIPRDAIRSGTRK
jgi:hypothetical protein